MKIGINHDEFVAILSLSHHIAEQKDTDAEEDYLALGRVFAAVSPERDGSAYIEANKEVVAALARLLDGRTGFQGVETVLNNVRVFINARSNGPGHRWYFEHSPTLRFLATATFESAQQLIDELSKRRSSIIAELNRAKSSAAPDIYDRSPTLQNIPPDVLQDDRALMRFLLTYRDRIAVENRRATGNLDHDQFTFAGAENNYSLGTLIHALSAGGVIDRKRAANVIRLIATPLQYFVEHRNKLETGIRQIENPKNIFADIDRSLFMKTSDPTQPLSKPYIQRIIQWARWFLGDPEVAVRSIYAADEIAFMTFLFLRDIVDAVPENIAARLENAGYNSTADPAGARREAVGAIKDLLDYYVYLKVGGSELDLKTEEGLTQIARLYEWNRDAIDDDPDVCKGDPGIGSDNEGPSPASGGNSDEQAAKAQGSQITGFADSQETGTASTGAAYMYQSGDTSVTGGQFYMQNTMTPPIFDPVIFNALALSAMATMPSISPMMAPL